jgi:site-specific DNA-methyltransferase (adenine-specific)
MNPILHYKDFFKSWDQIKENSIDLILTDPPYGILSDVQKWDIIPPIKEMESIFNKLLKPNGQVIIFCDLNLLMELLSGLTNHFRFRFYLIWQKTSPMPISQFRPMPETEFILVFRKKGSLEKNLTWNWRELGEKGNPYTKKNYGTSISTRKGSKQVVNTNGDGWRYPRQIMRYENKPNMKEAERSIHPTQKPEALLRRLVRTFSNTVETILDPFAGSGSTLISSFKEDRHSIGFELEKRYFKDAQQRINTITAQESLFSEIS